MTRRTTFALLLAVPMSLAALACSSDDHHAVSRNDRRDAVNRPDIEGHVVARGTGRLNYEVPTDGTIVVLDLGTNREVVSHRVRRGDLLTVNPGDDNVTLNRDRIYNSNMEGNNPHAIVLRPDLDNARRASDYDRR